MTLSSTTIAAQTNCLGPNVLDLVLSQRKLEQVDAKFRIVKLVILHVIRIIISKEMFKVQKI